MRMYRVPKYVQHRIMDLLSVTPYEYQIERFVQKYIDLTYIEVIDVSVKIKDGSRKSILFEPDPDIGVDWWDILSHLKNTVS